MMLLGRLWGAAVRHVVYILNHVPTRALNDKTPYEAWMGRKPNLEHLRVSVCVGHIKIPSTHTMKLDYRSKLMIHLEVGEGCKAYRMYDPSTGKVHVSRDVHFEEQRRWEWGETATHNEQAWFMFTVDDVAGEHNGELEQSGGEEQVHVPPSPTHSPGSIASPATPISPTMPTSATSLSMLSGSPMTPNTGAAGTGDGAMSLSGGELHRLPKKP